MSVDICSKSGSKPKTPRLTASYDFQRVYREGRTLSTKYLVLHILKKGGAQNSRVGFSIKGQIGSAVVRNRLRRQLKEAYRLNENKLKKGCDLVIRARKEIKEKPFREVERTLLEALARGGLFEKEK